MVPGIKHSVLDFADAGAKMGNMLTSNQSVTDRAACEFLRAIRGKRSQRAFAKRLGYRGNPITDWENGRRYPTAEEAFRACERAGFAVTAAFARFHQAAPPEQSRGGILLGPWLNRVRGTSRINQIAQCVPISRHALARYFRGDAKPRLPDFFRIVDAITDRLPHLVAELVSIDGVPSLRPRFLAAEAARLAAYEAPWTEAILRVLELDQYRARPEHRDADIAMYLGISTEEVQKSIAMLSRSGVIRMHKSHYEEARSLTVDTRGSAELVDKQLRHWLGVALQKLAARAPQQLFAYNVVSVSQEDYRRIRALLASTFREVATIVAASEPAERVAMVGLQWLDLQTDALGP